MATEAIPPKPKVNPREEEAKKILAEQEANAGISEETKKKFAELKSRMGRSRLEVKSPAGYTPYWARKGDTAELSRLDYLGFRIVREKPGQERRYSAQGYRDDGTYVMGDVILMEIRTEDYNFFLSENAKRGEQMSEAAKAKLVEDLESKGAPTFKVQRKA